MVDSRFGFFCSGVGKTSIIYSHKYGGTGFLAHSATIGASYINCNVVVDKDPIQLQIWDTAGQERFKCMVSHFLYIHFKHSILYP